MPSSRLVGLLVVFMLYSSMAVRAQRQLQQDAADQTDVHVQPLCSYSGLFESESDFSVTSESGLFFKRDALFGLSKYERSFTYKETCSYERVTDPSSKGVEMQTCAADIYPVLPENRIARSPCYSCCATEMSISVPGTVTNLYSGVQYQAKHHASSYQFINLGHCSNPGGTCGMGGTCNQAYRIHWVLVTTPSGDQFVPTSVPSHCTCIYT